MKHKFLLKIESPTRSTPELIELSLTELPSIAVVPGAVYTVIDADTGEVPEGLEFKLRDGRLVLEKDGEEVAWLDQFFGEFTDSGAHFDGSFSVPLSGSQWASAGPTTMTDAAAEPVSGGSGGSSGAGSSGSGGGSGSGVGSGAASSSGTAGGSGLWGMSPQDLLWTAGGGLAVAGIAVSRSGSSSSSSSGARPAPTTTISGIDISDDSNINSDFITNVAGQTVTATLSASLLAEETLLGSVDGGATFSDITDKVGGTGIIWDNVTLVNGSSTIQLKVTNAAGDGALASQEYTLDMVAPLAPTVTGVSDDTGSSDSDGLTSDTALLINGTAEAGSTVAVFVDDTEVGTSSADGDGNWSFDYTGTELAEGEHSITATATDTAGNTSAASDPFAVTVDTTAPAAPAVTGVSDDSGSSDSDGITNDSTLVITGTAVAGSTVAVFVDGTEVGTTTADGDGNWTFDHTDTELSDGEHTITAAATDAAGNTSAASDPFTVTVDTTAPVAPTVTGVSDDTGSSDSDGVTSDTTLFINGTAEAGSTVAVFVDGTEVGTTTADGDGNWTFDHTDTELSDGEHTITATATDAADNTSAASDPFTVTVDTTAPAAPTVTGVSDDTGSSDSDGITSDNTLVIAGTAVAGSTVAVFVDGTEVGTTTADGDGNWTFDHTDTELSDGEHTITATATDSAGNESPASQAFTVTIDTVASSTTVGSIDISSDTGEEGDFVTSTAAQTITARLSAQLAEGDILLGSVDGGATFIDITDKVIPPSPPPPLQPLASDGMDIEWDGVTLVEGSNSIVLKVSDVAGNDGAVASQDYELDTGTPDAPVVSGIGEDTGSSDSDGVTSDDTLVISGTAEADSTVTVFIDGAEVGSTTADGDGNWSFGPTNALAEGGYSITATATDTAGNISAESNPFTVTVDTTAPATPTIAGVSDDTGNSDSDGVTSDGTLVISGTAAAGSTVSVLIDDTEVGTATADGDGNWSFDHTATELAEGDHSIVASVTDTAGNTATSNPFAVTVDTIAATPVVTAVRDDTGSSDSDGVTNDNTLFVDGTAEADSAVTVFIDGAEIGTTTADGDGSWTFDHTGTPLADGTYQITASSVDVAGNASAASEVYTVTVDSSSPDAPIITGVSEDTGRANDDNITNDDTLTVSGTAEAGSTVTVSVDGVEDGTAVADESGSWAYTFVDLEDGGRSITATATDTAGNTSAASAPYAVTIDTVAPDTPVINGVADDTGASDSDGITSDQTLFVTGSAPVNSLVTVSIDGNAVGLVAANGAGNWSFGPTDTLAEGEHQITAVATDVAGNASAPGTFTVVVDNTVPDAPTVTGVTDDTGGSDGVTSDDTLVVTGMAEANSTVTVSINGAVVGTTTADGAGNWSFDHTATPLSEGAHDITATATDAAGNTSVESTAFTVTVDKTAPAEPTVTGVEGDTGDDSDGVTSDNTLIIRGTAVAGSLVTVFVDGTEAGAITADDVGDWVLDYTGTELAEGDYDITATATDTAGNESAASAPFTVTVDATAPDAPAVTGVSDDSGSSDSDGITNDNTLVVAGTAEANSVVTVFINGVEIDRVAADASGDWSFDHSGTTLAEGDYAITATATDTAGNTSSLSSAFAVTVDTAAPPTVISGAAYHTDDNELILKGTGFDSLLADGEDAATDIKARLDAGKLQWDIDSDNTDNVTFMAADFDTAEVRDANTLVITFSDAKATELEATPGFDNFFDGGDDTIEIATGFTGDAAGNASTTDDFDGPGAPDDSIVVFDLVSGQSSGHSGRTFDAAETYTIYIRVPSEDFNVQMNEMWSGADNLGADDQVILVGTGSDVLGWAENPVADFNTAMAGLQLIWDTATAIGGVAAANLFADGGLSRTYDGFHSAALSQADLWSGTAGSFANNGGTTLANVYRTAMPSGVMTSQGLI